MAIRILSSENITGDITTSGKVNAGDRILTEATTSNALLQVKYNASNYLEAYYDTLNVVGGDFLIKRAGDTKIQLTSVGTTFTNLSNTSAASSSVDEVKIGTFGAGRPAIFLGSSNATYTNSTWFIENIGASGKFRIGRNGLDILEIENSGASTFKATSVTVLHASDPSVAVSDTDTNYKGIMTWRNSGSENVLDFVTRYGGTYYTKNLVLDRGKVGIGTYTPFTNLEIEGSGLDSIIRLYTAGGTANIRTWEMRAVGVAGEGLLFRQVNDANTVYTNRMILDNNGDVGIGTISPAAQLHINNDTSNSYATLRLEGSNRGGIIEMYNQTSYPVSSIQTDQSGNTYFATSGAFASTTLSPKMTILTGGNVGIGTTSPSSYNSNADNLVIYETGDFNGITLAADNDQGSNIYFADPDDDNVGGITYNHTNNYMNFRANGIERIRIDSSGNVGIGVTPNAPAGNIQLDVGDNGCGMTSRQNNELVLQANANYGTYAQAGVPATRLNLTNSGEFHFLNAPAGAAVGDTISFTERMRITSSGKVVVQGENFVIDDVREHREEFFISGSNAYNFDVDIKNIGASGQPFEVFVAFTHYSTSYGAAYHAAYYQRSTVQSDITLIHEYFNQNSTRGGIWTVVWLSATQIRISKSAGVGGSIGYGYLRVTQVDF